MPLDPQLQPILGMFGGELAVIGKTPEEVRAMMSSFDMPRSDDGLRSVEDVTVAGLPARVYRAEGTGSPEPVFVYYHGGGFVIGSIANYDATCASIAADSGVTVISVEYRLAPEHPFPEPVEDAYAALAYVADQAAELGVDASRLAVGGDSAGGNLAAVVTHLARERGGPALAYQLLIYPGIDLTMSYPSIDENGALRYMLSRESMEWFCGHYLPNGDDADDWRASPLNAPSFDGLPPAFVITAEFDPLRDEGEAYAERLRASGTPVRLHRVAGACHGFYAFPIDSAKAIHAEITAELRTALRP